LRKEVTIQPPKYFRINWKEIIEYRSLLWNLALRDFKVRYVNTILGSLWAIFNPLVTVVFLVFIFRNLANIKTFGIPMIVFSMAGMVVWTFASSMISEGGNALLSGQNLISKVYFPKIILPLSKAITAAVDTVFNLLILSILLIWYKQSISLNIIYLPLILFVTFLSGLFMSLLVSSLILRYRDFQFIIPIILRLSFFICPISYPSSLVPMDYKVLYFTNPFAGLMELMRWSIFIDYKFDQNIYVSLAMVVILGVVSIAYFSKIESKIVDYL
jgi:lipopolysaccharide transport system permease protein